MFRQSNTVYPNDTSDALSPPNLSETTKSPSKPRLRALMSGGPINHCTKRVSAGGGWASRRYFVHAASGSIIGYINNPDGTGNSVNTIFLVKNNYYSRSFSLFVFGWEGETTETAMGAIFVHARSLGAFLAAGNMVKVKKRAF